MDKLTWHPWSGPGTWWWRSLWPLQILLTVLCDAPTQGLSTSISEDSPVVREFVISLKSQRLHFWFGSQVLVFLLLGCWLWGASRQGRTGNASEGLHCSSSRRCQALFHQQELQMQQHHLRSPGLQEILLTQVATIQDEFALSPILGIPASVGVLALPVVFKGVGGLASSSADVVGVVIGVTDSSFATAGVVIRVAEMFSGTDGTMAKTVGLSTAGGSMGLGWVASSTSTLGNPVC